MYVRMLGCMTLLRVHVTHTQHTHTHAHNTHTCLVLYVCIFGDYVKGSLYVQSALHCTVCYSWDSLGFEGAGVRKCLSLSERGGTTS